MIQRLSFSARIMVLCFLAILLGLGSPVLGKEEEHKKTLLSVAPLDLTRPPTTSELMAAGQLEGELYPTMPIDRPKQEKLRAGKSKEESVQARYNLSFGRAIGAWNRHEYKKASKMFAELADKEPDSPWAAEALLHVGCEASHSGRNKEAARHFTLLLNVLKGNDYIGARMVRSKALTRLATLRVSENNREEASRLFAQLKQESPDWRQRTYASHWLQRLSREGQAHLSLYTCGTQALAHVLRRDSRTAEADAVEGMSPQTPKGHSLQELRDIAARYHYPVTVARLTADHLSMIQLPAVVHITYNNNTGHYQILERVDGDVVTLFDPQGETRFTQTKEEFQANWSGNVLVFQEAGDVPGEVLSEKAATAIQGGCCCTVRPEDDLGDPDCPDPQPKGPSNSSSGNPFGTPVWSVNMINLNLYIKDIPLWHSAAYGPSFHLQLSYNSQSAIAGNERFGNKWIFGYGSYLVVDPSDTITVFMPDGRRDKYVPVSPDADNTSFTPPRGVYNTLTKLSDNHFLLTFPGGTSYTYNIPQGTSSQQPFLTRITDRYGHSMLFSYVSYDSEVRLTHATDATGNVFSFTYNAQGLVTRVSDPFDRFAQMDYDAAGNLVQITDMGGYATRFGYDGDIYPTFIENDRGRWTFYVEPADGISNRSNPYPAPGTAMGKNYRITVTDPEGGISEYFYEQYTLPYDSWQVSPRDYIPYVDSATNAYQKSPKTTYKFFFPANGLSRISKVTTPARRVLSYSYDADGNRTVIHDGESATRYVYNALGKPTQITAPNGAVSQIFYEDNGVDIKELKTALGSIHFTYTAKRDIATVTDINNKTWHYAYNNHGQLTRVTDPLGRYLDYVYGANNRLQSVKQNDQTILQRSYDNAGRVVAETDQDGLTLEYSYNNLNHPTRVTWPDSKTEEIIYSASCPRLIRQTVDRAGRSYFYSYDKLRRLNQSRDPEEAIQRFLYDANGNLTAFLDPQQTKTSFTYDLDNLLTGKSYADGASESYQHNTRGLTSKTINARGVAVDYIYSANGNLTHIRYTDSTPDVTLTWDVHDRLIKAVDGSGITQFTYDAASRLIAVDGPWADDTITYSYDDLGRVATVTPQNSEPRTYVYDSMGRISGIRVAGKFFSYAYTSPTSSLVQSLTRPSDAVTSYSYDPLKRLTGVNNAASVSTAISASYTYNNQDLRDTETISGGLPAPTAQDQLTQGRFNELNQLLGQTNPEREFVYDQDGNLTQGYTKDGFVFQAVYDAENRLSSITYTDGEGVSHKTIYTYRYDSFLAKIAKYRDDVLIEETRIIRDGLLALQDRDSNNNVIREYVWGLNLGGGIGGLLNIRQDDEDYNPLYDGKGNIIALLDNNRNVAAQYRYSTFGRLETKTGTVDQPFGFSSKRTDSALGLIYYGYRFYNPVLQRWLNRDPLGEAGGINLYTFVENDPVNWVDPWGLVRWEGTSAQGGIVITWGVIVIRFDLESECIDGKKAYITVWAVGPAAGIGSKYSVTFGTVSFEDYKNKINPRNFNGIFAIGTAGATFHPGLPIRHPGTSIYPGAGPGVGIGASYIKLGGAYSDITLNPGLIGGYDKSLTGSIGSSTVTDSKIERCICVDN